MTLPAFRTIRDRVLFLVGLAGVASQTVAFFMGLDPSETLLVTFAAMMGLPAFLRADEKSNGR